MTDALSGPVSLTSDHVSTGRVMGGYVFVGTKGALHKVSAEDLTNTSGSPKVIANDNSWLTATATSRDGAFLFVSSTDNNVYKVDVDTLEIVSSFQGHSNNVWCMMAPPLRSGSSEPFVITAGYDGKIYKVREDDMTLADADDYSGNTISGTGNTYALCAYDALSGTSASYR